MLVLVRSSLPGQVLTPEYLRDSLPSPDAVLLSNVDRYATKEYYERKEGLRSFHQERYAEVLAAEIQADGLGALIAYVKLKLHEAYSLNHAPITTLTEWRYEIVLPLDWRMPVDPWKKEK